MGGTSYLRLRPDAYFESCNGYFSSRGDGEIGRPSGGTIYYRKNLSSCRGERNHGIVEYVMDKYVSSESLSTIFSLQKKFCVTFLGNADPKNNQHLIVSLCGHSEHGEEYSAELSHSLEYPLKMALVQRPCTVLERRRYNMTPYNAEVEHAYKRKATK